MKAWVALFKKDFKLTRTAFFIGLIIDVLIVMLTIYLGMNAENLMVMFIPVVGAVVFHLFYIPLIMLISLKTEERQLHLWLHNPGPASALLLSKLVNGLVMSVISLLMLFGMVGLLMMIPKFSLIDANWTHTWMSALWIFPHIILISVTLGVPVMFFWALYHFLKYRIGRWSVAVVGGAIVLLGWLDAWFESTKLFTFNTQWGSMQIDFHFSTFTLDPIRLYTGEYFFTLLIATGLFFLSAWIIDNKIEV